MSGFLLDTNVVSELIRPKPDDHLTRWVEETDESILFLSVLTLGEIRQGVERLRAGRRRGRLESWLQVDLPSRFEGRILPIDHDIAKAWGKTVSRSEALGRPPGAMNAFLSATAEVHRLSLVTRNVSDFPLLKALVNPWV